MPDTARSRTGLQAFKGDVDDVRDIDTINQGQMNILESTMALDDQGAFSARPPSTVGAPGKPGRYYRDEFGRLHRDNGTGWDTYAPMPPFVTSLPSSPVDGQEVMFVADAANGVVWHLKYRTADPSAYKWQFIGGATLSAFIATTEQKSTAFSTYSDLATVGPTVVLPLMGDYEVTLGTYANNANANTELYMSFAVGAATALDADGVRLNNNTSTLAGVAGHVQRTWRRNFAAAATLTAKYRTTNQNGYFADRQFAVRPVRVG